MREWIFLLIRFAQFIALSFTANAPLATTGFYKYFFGFIRLDIALLPAAWFYALFWVAFALTLSATIGLHNEFSPTHSSISLCLKTWQASSR